MKRAAADADMKPNQAREELEVHNTFEEAALPSIFISLSECRLCGRSILPGNLTRAIGRNNVQAGVADVGLRCSLATSPNNDSIVIS